MPSIRIDQEVYSALQKQAEPFIDSPNSVLRRILGLEPGGVPPEGEAPVTPGVSKSGADRSRARQRPGTSSRRARRKKGRTRVAAGSILAEDQYVEPLLNVLVDRGGSAPAREVIDEVGTRLNGRLTTLDRELLASGSIRWQNRAQFVRLRLVEEGLLKKGSSRGVWEITEEGRRRLKEMVA